MIEMGLGHRRRRACENPKGRKEHGVDVPQCILQGRVTCNGAGEAAWGKSGPHLRFWSMQTIEGFCAGKWGRGT